MRQLLALYFVVIGVTSAFTPSALLPLPLAVALCLGATCLLALARGEGEVKLGYGALFFALFLGWSYLAFALQVIRYGLAGKGFSHALSYPMVFVCYLAIPFIALRLVRPTFDDLCRWISRGALVVAIYMLFESFVKNFCGITPDAWLFWSHIEGQGGDYAATVNSAGVAIDRVRGFASESAVAALYLAMAAPFTWCHYRGRSRRSAAMAILSIGFLATMSVAGICGVIVSGTMCLVPLCWRSIRHKNVAALTWLVGLASALVLVLSLLPEAVLAPFVAKITFDDVSSAQDRLLRWMAALDMIKESPLAGSGPGAFAIKTGTGATSFYLTLLVEFGLIGLGLFALPLLVTVRRLFSLPARERFACAFALIAALAQYAIISDYWLPWLWSLLAVIWYLATEYGASVTLIAQGDGHDI